MSFQLEYTPDYIEPRRISNRDGTISMITVTNTQECITYQLWLPEQDEEWIWNNKHESLVSIFQNA